MASLKNGIPARSVVRRRRVFLGAASLVAAVSTGACDTLVDTFPTPGIVVYGVVTDTGGSPVSSASVSVFALDGTCMASSDETASRPTGVDGRFSVLLRTFERHDCIKVRFDPAPDQALRPDSSIVPGVSFRVGPPWDSVAVDVTLRPIAEVRQREGSR